jgi:hypothetical protein
MAMGGVVLKKETSLDVFAQSQLAARMRCCGNCRYYAIGHCHKESQIDVNGTRYSAFLDCRKNFKHWEFNGGSKSLF